MSEPEEAISRGPLGLRGDKRPQARPLLPLARRSLPGTYLRGDERVSLHSRRDLQANFHCDLTRAVTMVSPTAVADTAPEKARLVPALSEVHFPTALGAARDGTIHPNQSEPSVLIMIIRCVRQSPRPPKPLNPGERAVSLYAPGSAGPPLRS